MSFNFHNHKMRMVTTEEKPVSFNPNFTPMNYLFIADVPEFYPAPTPNTVPATRVLHALTRGLEKIKQGWTKGTLKRSLGGGRMAYCARGALVQGHGYNHAAETYLHRALPPEVRHQFGSFNGPGDLVAYYNDCAATTEADIHALYERAIALAEAEGA
jgi:hypothetical protein